MFERKLSPDNSENQPAKIHLFTKTGEPVEFIYQGVRFHINEVLTTWLQSNNWWQQMKTGEVNQTVSKYWHVQAAPVGALTTFEIEFNQINNSWQIRPSSRGESNG